MGIKLVVIGASLGGLAALKTLLAALPAGFPCAVAIVQHQRAGSGAALGTLLRGVSALPLHIVEDKDVLEPGRVYFAPPDYHLLIEPGRCALSTAAPVNFARPSVDVLFESAADAYGPGVIAIVLTGTGTDGADGVRKIQARGGLVLVQRPGSAEAAGMPEAAVAALPVAVVRLVELEEIPALLLALCRKGA